MSKEEALADMAARGFDRGSRNACAMCKLAKHGDDTNDEALRVREEDHAIVVLDRYASTRGDLLVILREHVERITDLPLATHLEVQRLVFEAHATLEELFAPRRIYSATLGSSSEPEANPPAMSFPHLHVHVIPVHDDGESARPAAVFSWTAGVWLYDEGEAEQLARELRAAWRSSR
ncbi:MAG: HIT family protein [Labilithrix sp.]|nr:HIT family protein [Labilithrix sp.]